MSEYKKIGNRYYKVEDNVVTKATYNLETDEYEICGKMHKDEFMNGDMKDGNTVENLTTIKTHLQTEIDKELEIKK